MDGQGAEKPSDCVEAVREREPGFKAESIPPDDAAAVEALAATSIDRLEAYHGQEVTVAGVRLTSHGPAVRNRWCWSTLLRWYREVPSGRDPTVIRGRVAAEWQGLTLVLGREIHWIRERK